MRKYLLVFLFAVIAGHLSAQPAGGAWYHAYSGTIGKTVITMHLHKTGQEYYGYYYYDRTRQPIYFFGNDTTGANGEIQLTAYIPGAPRISMEDDAEMSESFSLAFSGNQLQGQWRKGEKGSPAAVTLREKAGAIPFEMVYTKGERKLRPSLPESPVAEYFAGTIWPVNDNSTSTFVKRAIREDFGAKTDGEEIGQLLLVQKNQILDAYIDENKDLHDSLFTEFSSAYNLSEDRKLLVAFESPALLTLASHAYAYTGGAHGNYGTTFICIDLAANKKIVLADVLTAAGISRLGKELEKEFRLQAGLKPGETLSDAGLFDNKIEPNDNFYLTTKGIGFSYMPYEIAPYAMGEISLFLPFSRLSAYLQPAAKKWMSQ